MVYFINSPKVKRVACMYVFRAIKREVKVVDQTFGRCLHLPFDPYDSTIKFLLASYVITDVAPPGYVRIAPRLQNATLKKVGVQILLKF
ncbi:hypothetical protein CR513_43652, partial [Mucuna pruriens]